MSVSGERRLKSEDDASWPSGAGPWPQALRSPSPLFQTRKGRSEDSAGDRSLETPRRSEPGSSYICGLPRGATSTAFYPGTGETELKHGSAEAADKERRPESRPTLAQRQRRQRSSSSPFLISSACRRMCPSVRRTIRRRRWAPCTMTRRPLLPFCLSTSIIASSKFDPSCKGTRRDPTPHRTCLARAGARPLPRPARESTTILPSCSTRVAARTLCEGRSLAADAPVSTAVSSRFPAFRPRRRRLHR